MRERTTANREDFFMLESDRSGTGHDPLDRLIAEMRRIANLLEDRVAPALERLAESSQVSGTISPAANPLDPIRRALRAGNLREADDLISDLDAGAFDAAELESIRVDFARGRDARIGELRSRLDASRLVNDHETALGLEEELSSWLDPAARVQVRADVVRWLIGLLMKRMRSGTVGVDVAFLAARIAGRFGDTAEGASLRASLPTLRRSAGLCAQCGEPYTGVEDACPKCLNPHSKADRPDGPPVPPPETL
jgi:hypothetical protein